MAGALFGAVVAGVMEQFYLFWAVAVLALPRATLLLAQAVWVGVEKPLLAWRERVAPRRPPARPPCAAGRRAMADAS